MKINIKKIFFDLLILVIVIAVVAVSLGAIYYISRGAEAIGYGYYRDGKNIVYGPYKERVNLDVIDAKSFRALSKQWGKDKNYTYFIYPMGEDCCYARTLPLSVDIDSFRALDSRYAVDKNYVYKNDKIVEGVNPNNFVPPPPSSE
ncbi:MAG TPA: DKNYY domain-containing protein [Candidatus Methylomirabilis sp.]|nr:DKNYY domain-containing protein [Candidatus Methylomirabilis sp.]